MKSAEEFKSYYDEKLLPSLKELDAKRKKTLLLLLAFTIGYLFLLGFCAAVIILLFYTNTGPCNICCLAMAPLLLIPAFFIGWSKIKEGYVKDFKAQIMPKIVKFLDEGLNYEYSKHIPLDIFGKSRIFLSRADIYNGEDYVSGTVGKTKIEFSEINAQEKHEYTDSKGHHHTTYTTFFNGIFFVADFNKSFKGITLVLPDYAEKSLGKMIGGFFQKHNISRPPLIKLEDPEFEKLFVVYGDDQVQSRYILSTSLMQRITEFKKKTNKNIHLSFVENNVMMAIPYGKALFEPRLFRSIVDYTQAESFYADLQLVIGIVEDLNLNTRIWTKE